MANDEPPQFGDRLPDRDYAPRPGACALILNGEGLLLVIRGPSGLGLPGGGIDSGETPERALVREVLEEIGHEVTVGHLLCSANQYVSAPDEGGGFNKEGMFYLCALGVEIAAESDDDHEPVWLEADVAVRELAEQNQRWAVEQLRARSGR